jgi:hypothetical protein
MIGYCDSEGTVIDENIKNEYMESHFDLPLNIENKLFFN